MMKIPSGNRRRYHFNLKKDSQEECRIITSTTIRYDQLWKDVITELFDEFLLFFSPELFELVDFAIPPQFLEQELQTILRTTGIHPGISMPG
ncbi:hypothetical protein [Siminovitchia fortis]|uniref:hypothetical protein n=1 Tax=Siminovitchia fortis TaxID=254758 RepID=UPI0011A541DB|nr:hypothetical protein [Siminovitchia fortis]